MLVKNLINILDYILINFQKKYKYKYQKKTLINIKNKPYL